MESITVVNEEVPCNHAQKWGSSESTCFFGRTAPRKAEEFSALIKWLSPLLMSLSADLPKFTSAQTY